MRWLLPLLCVAASALAQPDPELPPDTTDYGAAYEAADEANSTNHQAKALREAGLKNYAKGQIDFELLDLTTDALDDEPAYPPELARLEGKEVEMIGFMTPYDSIEEFRRFMVVNFPTGCNFCAIPRLQEILFVEIDKDLAPPDFIEGVVHVKGTLHLKHADNNFFVEGFLPGEQHDVFSEFIYIIGDATASEYEMGKASSSARERPAWFWPAAGGVLLLALLAGIVVYRQG